MRSARLAVVACCWLLLFVAAATAVAAAPPPSRLCGVCGPGADVGPHDDAGIAGATADGTLDIYVDEAGDSLWHARVPVTATAAERYRTNGTALGAAVDAAWPRYHAAAGDVRAVDATMDGDTVVVNYTVDDVARRGVGDSWLLDYFVDGRSPTRYEQVAERVTIHAPAGTAVTNRPVDADVEGNTATWTRDDGGSTARGFDEATYVTYGEDGPLGTASGYATIGREVGPPALAQGLLVGLVPGVLIGGAGLATRRLEPGPVVDAATLERAIIGTGAVGAVGILLVGALTTPFRVPPAVVALASLGVGYLLLGAVASRIGDRLGTRGLTALAVFVTAAAAALTRLFAGPTVYPFPPLFGLATALFLPIGYDLEDGRTPVVPVTVCSLVPIAAATTTTVPTFRPASGWSLLMAVLQVLPWVAVVAAFGTPLALLGRRLAEA